MDFALTQHIQDSMLRLVLTDDDVAKRVAGAVKPKHFPSRIAARLAEIAIGYVETYREAPKDHLQDLLARRLRGAEPADADELRAYVDRVLGMEEPNVPFVLRRVNEFIRQRERDSALLEAGDLLDRGETDAADNVLYAALKSGIPSEDDGLDYLRDMSSLDNEERRPLLMPTGIKAMDRLIGGYRRGQLVVTLGGYKGGKTWFLMDLAKTAILRGLRVLHISLELSREEMELRYDMMLSRRGTRRIGQYTATTVYKPTRHKTDSKRFRIGPVNDRRAVLKARKRIAACGGRMFIKKYPMGRSSPAEVERYLNELEATRGFVPDVVIIDYLDIMDLKSYSSELRHQLNESYIWAKGLADERNILVATVSQVRREALQKLHVRQQDVAEDARKVGNVDLMLAIGRDRTMEKMGMAGLSVLANREGPQGSYCKFGTCFDIGQFCVSSWLDSDIEKDEEEGTDYNGS